MTPAQIATMGEAIAAAAYMADKGTGEQDRAEARAQCADLTAKLNAVLNPPTPPVQMVPVRLFDEGDQL